MVCTHKFVIRGNILQAKCLCFDALSVGDRICFCIELVGEGVIPAAICEYDDLIVLKIKAMLYVICLCRTDNLVDGLVSRPRIRRPENIVSSIPISRDVTSMFHYDRYLPVLIELYNTSKSNRLLNINKNK
jgi:hypothetical protein